MKNRGASFTCHSCGNRVETPPGEPPCEALKDWLVVSNWKGAGEASHYSFCSFSCLKSWVDAQMPKIPEEFLEPFKENEN